MRDVHLNQTHLSEAVRQKILTVDQMERLVSLAGAGPVTLPPGRVGPASFILAVAAGLAVIVFGVQMFGCANDEGISTAAVATSVSGLVACLVGGALLRRFRWGQLPGSILHSGAAVFSWGVAVGLVTRIEPVTRPPFSSTYAEPGGFSRDLAIQAYCNQICLTFASASLISLIFAIALWRFQRCRPALLVAAAHPVALCLVVGAFYRSLCS